jgi:proteic killer suppression protein
VDIVFGSRELETLCHDDKLATRTLGAQSARKLRARLDDLAAAACLAVAPKLPGRFHSLTGDRKGQFAFHLQDGRRLVVEPANNPMPLRTDGSVDLIAVTAVRVVFIGDYHD